MNQIQFAEEPDFSTEVDVFVEMATESELLRQERDEAIAKLNVTIGYLKNMIWLADDAGLTTERETINSREFLLSIGVLSSEE